MTTKKVRIALSLRQKWMNGQVKEDGEDKEKDEEGDGEQAVMEEETVEPAPEEEDLWIVIEIDQIWDMNKLLYPPTTTNVFI